MGTAVLIVSILGITTSMLLIPPVLRFGHAAALLERPNDLHHTHSRPVPRLGGAVLVVAFIVVEAYIAGFHPELRAGTPKRNVIIAGSLAMFALGFWDDVRPLRAGWKLLGQILIAATVSYCGVGIEVWTSPFAGTPIHLGAWGTVLTVAWLVGLTNLINLIDGADGLAGGISLNLMILIAAVAHQNGNFELLASGMAGALLGFLWYNFPPARIYLGDGGAYFLGFQIGLFSLVNSHKGTVFAALVAPLFLLAFPMADAFLTLARRGLRGLPLFRPDRKHLHHRLMAIGCSRRKLVLWVYAFNGLFLLMGLAAFWSRGQLVPLLSGAAVLLLFACAGSFGFSRRWFAVHRVLRSSLRMREQIQYALSLTRWLELESRRTTSPDELWPDFVFVANKLGFASLKLTLHGEHRFWQRPIGLPGAVRQRYDCPGRQYGSIEFTALGCPLHRVALEQAASCQRECGNNFSECLADPRVFETVSELLAETWNRSAAQWNTNGAPLRFTRSARPKAAGENGNVLMRPPSKPSGVKPLSPRSENTAPAGRDFKTAVITPKCFMKNVVMMVAGLGWLAVTPLSTAAQLTINEVEAQLRAFPAAELPAKAATMVKYSKPPERTVMATKVVRAALRINPAAAPPVIGAVVRAVPEVAPLSVQAAVLGQPAQLEDIISAAVLVVPDRAGQIILAVCRVQPGEYRLAAITAARLAPSAAREILNAVGEARPELKPHIDKEMAACTGRIPSAASCLDRAEAARSRAVAALNEKNEALDPRGLSSDNSPGTSKDKPPHGNGKPPGGRNYARP